MRGSGHDFGHEGVAGTCLWCGCRIGEERDLRRVWDDSVRPVVGEEVHHRGLAREVASIRDLARGSGRSLRQAGAGDRVVVWEVRYEPPVWKGHRGEDGSPLFCTDICAVRFGVRMAELGHRLVKNVPRGDL